MSELNLIEIQWNVKDYAVDFLIPSKYDHIVLEHKEEIIDKLEFLTQALKNGTYPFGNIRGLGKVEE